MNNEVKHIWEYYIKTVTGAKEKKTSLIDEKWNIYIILSKGTSKVTVFDHHFMQLPIAACFLHQTQVQTQSRFCHISPR